MSNDTDAPGVPPALEGAAPDAPPPSVGSARRLADGTLHLSLRAELPDGSIGEAVMVVPPDDPRHAEILAHLGGLEPGRACPIPPFPPPLDDD